LYWEPVPTTLSPNPTARKSLPSAWALDDFGVFRKEHPEVMPTDPGPSAQELAVEEAWQAGHHAGRLEGEMAEQARLAPTLRAASDAIDDIRASEERWQGAIEENIIALATAIARHLLDREIEADVTVVSTLIERALEAFPIDQPVRVRVNPNDLAVIESLSAHDHPLPGAARGTHARWIADARIAPGGAMVEGRERIVDARVDSALERIYRRLTYTGA
jgi:flagellar assembly protein FliH